MTYHPSNVHFGAGSLYRSLRCSCVATIKWKGRLFGRTERLLTPTIIFLQTQTRGPGLRSPDSCGDIAGISQPDSKRHQIGNWRVPSLGSDSVIQTSSLVNTQGYMLCVRLHRHGSWRLCFQAIFNIFKKTKLFSMFNIFVNVGRQNWCS